MGFYVACSVLCSDEIWGHVEKKNIKGICLKLKEWKWMDWIFQLKDIFVFCAITWTSLQVS